MRIDDNQSAFFLQKLMKLSFRVIIGSVHLLYLFFLKFPGDFLPFDGLLSSGPIQIYPGIPKEHAFEEFYGNVWFELSKPQWL